MQKRPWTKSFCDKRETLELEILEMRLNTMKAVESEPTTNLKLTGENLKGIVTKTRSTTRCPLSPPHFNVVTEASTRGIRTEGDKERQRGKAKYKVSLFANDRV